MSTEKFREAFKSAYLMRSSSKRRTSRRSVEDLARLAALGRELLPLYLEVVEWRGFQRVLMLKV